MRRGGGRGPGWARKEAGALGPEAGAWAVPPAVEGSGGEGTCRRLGASTTRCRGGGRREGDASHGDGGGDWASGGVPATVRWGEGRRLVAAPPNPG